MRTAVRNLAKASVLALTLGLAGCGLSSPDPSDGTATTKPPAANDADGGTSDYFACSSQAKPPPAQPGGRVLVVDRRGAKYRSIASAVADVQPGDTIWLAPGSGPYPELVNLATAGRANQEIILDGNCEEIKASGPLSGFIYDAAIGRHVVELPRSSDPRAGSSIPAYWPQLLIHDGRRVIQNSRGKFSEDIRVVDLPGGKKQLQLPKGASTAGWEVGVRSHGIYVSSGQAYLRFRNAVIHGAADDGIGLTGGADAAHDITFQNVMAYMNFDEGLSAHGAVDLTIDRGVFWGNDNGLANQSRETVRMVANDILLFSNLGFGLAAQAGTNDLRNIRSWDNGLANFQLGAAEDPRAGFTGMRSSLKCAHLVTYASRWRSRPWTSYQETARLSQPPTPVRTYRDQPLPDTCPTPTVIGRGKLPSLVEPSAQVGEAVPPPRVP